VPIVLRLRLPLDNRLLRPAKMSEDSELARAPAETGQKLSNRTRCAAIFGQGQDAAGQSEVEPKRVERSPMQCDGRAIGDGPAEPCRGQIEGAQLWHDRHLVRRKATEQCYTDAVPKRVAAR
jgi:hypothetical protein